MPTQSLVEEMRKRFEGPRTAQLPAPPPRTFHRKTNSGTVEQHIVTTSTNGSSIKPHKLSKESLKHGDQLSAMLQKMKTKNNQAVEVSPKLTSSSSAADQLKQLLNNKSTETRETTPVADSDVVHLRTQCIKVLQELVETEVRYTRVLSIFVDQLINHLEFSSDPVIQRFYSKAPIALLCHMMNQLRDLNIHFLELLRDAAATGTNTQTATQWAYVAAKDVGVLFTRFSKLFKCYGEYAARHEDALATLIEARQTQPAVQAILSEFETKNNQTIQSVMIQPIQRLPRYLLLLRELVKKTPEKYAKHANDLLQLAVRSITTTANYVNDCVKQREARKALVRLNDLFTSGSAIWDTPVFNVLKFDRRLIRQGLLVKMNSQGHGTKKYYFHLFTDALVYSDQTTSGFRLRRTIEFTQIECSVTRAPDTGTMRNGFQVLTPNKSLLLIADTDEARLGWVNDIQVSISRSEVELEENRTKSSKSDDQLVLRGSEDDSDDDTSPLEAMVSSLTDFPKPQSFLEDSERTLIRQGQLFLLQQNKSGSSKMYQFFLLSDCILYAQVIGLGKFKYTNKLMLDMINVVDVSNDDDAVHAFQIVSHDNKTILTFCARDRLDKSSWMSDLNTWIIKATPQRSPAVHPMASVINQLSSSKTGSDDDIEAKLRRRSWSALMNQIRKDSPAAPPPPVSNPPTPPMRRKSSDGIMAALKRRAGTPRRVSKPEPEEIETRELDNSKFLSVIHYLSLKRSALLKEVYKNSQEETKQALVMDIIYDTNVGDLWSALDQIPCNELFKGFVADLSLYRKESLIPSRCIDKIVSTGVSIGKKDDNDVARSFHEILHPVPTAQRAAVEALCMFLYKHSENNLKLIKQIAQRLEMCILGQKGSADIVQVLIRHAPVVFQGKGVVTSGPPPVPGKTPPPLPTKRSSVTTTRPPPIPGRKAQPPPIPPRQ